MTITPSYIHKPYSGSIDYEDDLKVWSDRKIQIKLSKEDVNLALKNRFTLASSNNTRLKNNY
jgi:hypothetical protein